MRSAAAEVVSPTSQTGASYLRTAVRALHGVCSIFVLSAALNELGSARLSRDSSVPQHQTSCSKPCLPKHQGRRGSMPSPRCSPARTAACNTVNPTRCETHVPGVHQCVSLRAADAAPAAREMFRFVCRRPAKHPPLAAAVFAVSHPDRSGRINVGLASS